MKNLGLNLGQKKKLIKYIEYFKTIEIEDIPEPEEQILITKNSNEEDVAKFLNKKLHFSQDSIDALGLDGESLFLLEITEVQGLTELTEEERENLINYLKESKNEKLCITNESTEKEVAEFLKKELNFKDESIKELSLDGISLFLLKVTTENNNISKNEEELKNDSQNENKSEMESIKKEISKDKDISNIEDSKKQDNGNKENDEEKYKIQETPGYDTPKIEKNECDSKKEYEHIAITKESSKEEILKFVKIKLNFDEKKLFSISENEIDELSIITQEEKLILKYFLNKNKEKAQKDESHSLLKNIDNNEPAPSIDNFAVNNEDTQKSNIKNESEENNNLLNQIKKDNNKINNKNDNNNKEVMNDKNDNNNKILDNSQKNKNKINDPLSYPEYQHQFVKEERVFEEIPSDKKKLYSFQNSKVQPIYKISKFNIFFMLFIPKKYIKSKDK